MRLTELSRSIAGKNAVVTGGASGMGRATCHLFADEGARVLVVDRNNDAVQSVVSEIRSVYGDSAAHGCVGDVGTSEGRDAIAAQARAVLDGVDILVNNAGVSLVTSVHSSNEDFARNWSTTLDINVTAHAHLIREFLPELLKATSGGRVVNIASTEAIVATAGLSAYTASKHAVIGLTKSFAVELGSTGITVNAICPGPIETGMTSGIDAQSKEIYAKRRVPLRRYGQPDEVAHMTLSLCLPAASFINGATVVVDGGMSIRH